MSQLELLQVPACRQSRLGFDFTVGIENTTTPYAPPVGAKPLTAVVGWCSTDVNLASSIFSTGSHPMVRMPRHQALPEFHRHVGLRERAKPIHRHRDLSERHLFLGQHGGDHRTTSTVQLISSYREPGKLNLNSIVHNQVWLGLNGWLNLSQLGYSDAIRLPAGFGELVDSRKGRGNSGVAWEFNGNVPELIANPYRGYGAQELQPQMLNRTTNVEASILRSFEDFRNGTTGTNPLMQRSLNAATVEPYENGVRDAHHRFDSMMRLGNLTTNRSNVYAVWITVGYFEAVESAPGSGVWFPDRELGLDDGSTKRERAFYIIDRSIPTAYEPGVDHNIDEMVRLRRRIE
ncbi:MAG: hypothetical protein R3B96_17510 [Pirellulaceae bacterium]